MPSYSKSDTQHFRARPDLQCALDVEEKILRDIVESVFFAFLSRTIHTTQTLSGTSLGNTNSALSAPEPAGQSSLEPSANESA
jgi:hypothetical protein